MAGPGHKLATGGAEKRKIMEGGQELGEKRKKKGGGKKIEGGEGSQ